MFHQTKHSLGVMCLVNVRCGVAMWCGEVLIGVRSHCYLPNHIAIPISQAKYAKYCHSENREMTNMRIKINRNAIAAQPR